MVGVGSMIVTMSKLILLLMLVKQGSSTTSFSFPNFNESSPIKLEHDTYLYEGTLCLARNRNNASLNWKYGQASYLYAIPLWDPLTRKLASFTTHFAFSMRWFRDEVNSGDGMTFFLAPFDSSGAANSSGSNLGLFPRPQSDEANPYTPYDCTFVAVEFDTCQNSFDPSGHHVGIDVNAVKSVVFASRANESLNDGREANAWVTYDSASQNLSVFLTYDKEPVFSERYLILSYQLDLRNHLPEKVRVGFSASTGTFVQTNYVSSWSLNSSLDLTHVDQNTTLIGSVKQEGRVGLNFWFILGIGAFCFGICVFCAIYRKRRAARRADEIASDDSIDVEFGETGPKRFTYQELKRATGDFKEDRKLGEGGFGSVYQGFLSESNTDLAVKRISKGSRQGKKEYISEVRIISRLRHRNLVQLIGWCHTKGDFLLVYEFLPHGSLDAHIFGNKPTLTWTIRHKIAQGLVSSLLYLHEEWEQCVVHRDIKSSNIILDSNFNAKLGDFGLARFADHESGLQTTILAGTMGYMAPECVRTGKASKESDVYSFGVVALEICCGLRTIENNMERSKVILVEWVWDLYGQGRVLEAADPRLSSEFEEQQMESLMVVGLCCCHPDPSFRPSIRQAMSVLNFEAPLPNLPPELPRPMYFAPSQATNSLFYSSSTCETDGSRILEGR